MKQRLIVMNGQKLLQNEGAGEWVTTKVDKAGALRPGLYNLYAAATADPHKVHEGIILYADGDHVFQQAGNTVIKHPLDTFETVPEPGKLTQIQYVAGKAEVVIAAARRGRGISR